jgi:hypothetical protein
MPFTFSNAEYADVVYVYGFCDGSAAAVVEYRQRFPNRRIPDRRVFTRIFNTLRDAGTLSGAPVSSERQSQADVAEVENILRLVERSSGTSSRRLSTRLGVPHTRVRRTLRDAGLYPYHVQRVQHLKPGDPARRLEFCHWSNANRRFYRLMLFTDEATFTRDGINNSRNTHRWSQENPNAIVETNFQQRFSVNVWCGIIDDQVIGPFILEYRLTGQSYLAFLQNELPELLEDVPLATRAGMYFQHDGAPPHFSRAVIQHLNNTFLGR